MYFYDGLCISMYFYVFLRWFMYFYDMMVLTSDSMIIDFVD